MASNMTWILHFPSCLLKGRNSRGREIKRAFPKEVLESRGLISSKINDADVMIPYPQGKPLQSKSTCNEHVYDPPMIISHFIAGRGIPCGCPDRVFMKSTRHCAK